MAEIAAGLPVICLVTAMTGSQDHPVYRIHHCEPIPSRRQMGRQTDGGLFNMASPRALLIRWRRLRPLLVGSRSPWPNPQGSGSASRSRRPARPLGIAPRTGRCMIEIGGGRRARLPENRRTRGKDIPMPKLLPVRRWIVFLIIMMVGVAAMGARTASGAGGATPGMSMVDSVTPLSNGFLKHVYYAGGQEVGRLVAVAGAYLKFGANDGRSASAQVMLPSEAEPTTSSAATHAMARLQGYRSDDLMRIMREPDAGSMPNGLPTAGAVHVRNLTPLAKTADVPSANSIANSPPCDAGAFEAHTGYADGYVGWERWCLSDNDPNHRYSIEVSKVTAVSKGLYILDQVRLGNYYEWGLPYRWNPASSYTSGQCHSGWFEISGGAPQILTVSVHSDFQFCPDTVQFSSADLTLPNTHVTGRWDGLTSKPIELVTQTKERVANNKLSKPSFQVYLSICCND